MAVIKETKNYDLFVFHEFNRNIKHNNTLEKSMLAYGWLDAFPIFVVRADNKKLKIKAGHHRFCMAKKLNIPIKYIIGQNDINIHTLEKSTRPWTVRDYLLSHINCGRHPYVVVKEYQGRTGIGLQNCIAMLAGESAGSNNYLDEFKDGTYELGCPDHATIVGDIIIHCRKCNISFATHNGFVNAISKVAWVEEFDVEIFKKKVGSFFHVMQKQADLESYVNMIDKIYNRNNHQKIPLAFYAGETARKRHSSIYRNK